MFVKSIGIVKKWPEIRIILTVAQYLRLLS